MHRRQGIAGTFPGPFLRAARGSLLRSAILVARCMPALVLTLGLLHSPALIAQSAPAASFTLAMGSPTLSLAAGTGGTDTVSVQPANGFAGTVSFSVAGIPPGVDTAFLPATSTSGTTFVVYVPSGTAGGTFPITITGTSGSVSASTTLSLAIPIVTARNPTICQAQGSASYCSDQKPGPADGSGYHDLGWVNLNKALTSIAVTDNQVWGWTASGSSGFCRTSRLAGAGSKLPPASARSLPGTICCARSTAISILIAAVLRTRSRASRMPMDFNPLYGLIPARRI